MTETQTTGTGTTPGAILTDYRDVLRKEAAALAALEEIDADRLVRAVEILQGTRGRVIVCGMGKSGHIGRKIAATFASTGTPASFVHPAEASHGDLGMITADDVLLMLSNSGETAELADVIHHAGRFAIPMVAITKKPGSTLGRAADVALILPDMPEACPIGMAPTTSTTAQLALGDALAVVLMRGKGFTAEGFQTYHPGGKLGAKLLRVSALMHTGDALPVLTPDTPMSDGILEMTAKGFGVAAIIHEGRLAGIVTDGDLRRKIDGLMSHTAGEIATPNPLTVSPDTLAAEALGIMNRKGRTVLLVTDGAGRLEGLIHLHDCLRAGVS
jgi:arabinose-5-phosphate isomerase